MVGGHFFCVTLLIKTSLFRSWIAPLIFLTVSILISLYRLSFRTIQLATTLFDRSFLLDFILLEKCPTGLKKISSVFLYYCLICTLIPKNCNEWTHILLLNFHLLLHYKLLRQTKLFHTVCSTLGGTISSFKGFVISAFSRTPISRNFSTKLKRLNFRNNYFPQNFDIFENKPRRNVWILQSPSEISEN